MTTRLPVLTTALLFGVAKADSPRTVMIRGEAGNLGACKVPSIGNAMHLAEVHACEVPLVPSKDSVQVTLLVETGEKLKVFELAATRNVIPVPATTNPN